MNRSMEMRNMRTEVWLGWVRMCSMGASMKENYGGESMGEGVRGQVMKERLWWKGVVGHERSRTC